MSVNHDTLRENAEWCKFRERMMALDPAVVLALLARLDTLERALAGLIEEASHWMPDQHPVLSDARAALAGGSSAAPAETESEPTWGERVAKSCELLDQIKAGEITPDEAVRRWNAFRDGPAAASTGSTEEAVSDQ